MTYQISLKTIQNINIKLLNQDHDHLHSLQKPDGRGRYAKILDSARKWLMADNALSQ